MKLYYLSNGLTPIMVLMILLINSVMSHRKSTYDRLLRAVMITGIILGIFDTWGWLLIGKEIPYSNELQYFVNINSDIFLGLIAYLWFCYIYEELYGMTRAKLWKMFAAGSIAGIFMFFAITTPFNHLLFYMTESKEYVRGPLYFMVPVISLGYIFAASVMALFCFRSEYSESKRMDCLLMAAFPVFPTIGAVIQALHYGLSLYFPCLTFSILLIYLNQQNHNLSLDALTKLNNRGQLDNYLERRFASFRNDTSTYFLLIDVDRFKKINDQYGHLMGDQALTGVASVLKKALAGHDAFIARYGGDEFAVLIEGAGGEKMEHVRNKIEKHLHEFIQENNLPFTLSLSIGMAQCGKGKIHSIGQLIEYADMEMFRSKSLKKKAVDF